MLIKRAWWCSSTNMVLSSVTLHAYITKQSTYLVYRKPDEFDNTFLTFSLINTDLLNSWHIGISHGGTKILIHVYLFAENIYSSHVFLIFCCIVCASFRLLLRTSTLTFVFVYCLHKAPSQTTAYRKRGAWCKRRHVDLWWRNTRYERSATSTNSSNMYHKRPKTRSKKLLSAT